MLTVLYFSSRFHRGKNSLAEKTCANVVVANETYYNVRHRQAPCFFRALIPLWVTSCGCRPILRYRPYSNVACARRSGQTGVDSQTSPTTVSPDDSSQCPILVPAGREISLPPKLKPSTFGFGRRGCLASWEGAEGLRASTREIIRRCWLRISDVYRGVVTIGFVVVAERWPPVGLDLCCAPPYT